MKAFQRCVFDYLGRGGRTGRTYTSKLIWKRDPDQYVYIETGSKNRSGGLKQMNVENKVLPVYATPAANKRCLVFLLNLYIS